MFAIFYYTSTQINKRNCGVTELNVTKVVHGVATFNALLTCPSPFRHSNPFRNGSVTVIIHPPKMPIFCLKLVAVATSLDRSPNECKIY